MVIRCYQYFTITMKSWETLRRAWAEDEPWEEVYADFKRQWNLLELEFQKITQDMERQNMGWLLMFFALLGMAVGMFIMWAVMYYNDFFQEGVTC